MNKTTTFTKQQPQAVELEEVIIGALLIEKEAINKVELNADDFYNDSYKLIFKAITELKNSYTPIDVFTVIEKLKQNGTLENVGGVYRLTELTLKVTSSAHLSAHCAIVKQKSIARKMIAMSTDVQEMAYSEATDVADIIEFVEKRFTDIATSGDDSIKVSDIEDSLAETIEHIQEIERNVKSGKKSCVRTGSNSLNKELNGGWHAPDLIILGGRPSMGKTQWAVNFAGAAASDGDKVLFASIEMTKIQLLTRMITANDAIDFYKLKTGQLSVEEWKQIDIMMQKISKYNLYIADDYKTKYLNNIKTLARKMARSGDLKLIIIDYLGLICTNQKFGTRDLEIGHITRELKSLCKELNVPIILLSQLSRPVKGAKVRKPQLDDLRESGNIEQDADIVIFTHRPSYYDPDAVDATGESWHNRGVLILAKHREGELGAEVEFMHDDNFKNFYDRDEYINNPF